MTIRKGVRPVKGFPRGELLGIGEKSYTCRMNAMKLLDWLFENGWSPVSKKLLVEEAATGLDILQKFTDNDEPDKLVDLI